MAFGLPGQTPPQRSSGASPYSNNRSPGSPYSGSSSQSSPSGGLSNGGFPDHPDRRSSSNNGYSGSSRGSAPDGNGRVPARHQSGGIGSFSTPDIPWKFIIYGVLIAIAVVFIIVFRDYIRAFLSEVLSWLIIVGVVVLILRYIVFRRRR